MLPKSDEIPWLDGNLELEQSQFKKAESLISRHLEKEWTDGFITFSADEMRYNADLHENLKQWLMGRTGKKREKFNGTLVEGYLMEAGLWRNDGKVFEELAFERTGDLFLVNYWKLDTLAEPHQCLYRESSFCLERHLKPFQGITSFSAYEVKSYGDGNHLYIVRGEHG